MRTSANDSRTAAERLRAVLVSSRARAIPPATAAALCVAMAAGCSEPSAPAPSPSPTAAPSAADALAVYSEFWRLSGLAAQTPGSQDWSVPLATVARGQALDDLVLEIRNYQSLPAHLEGQVQIQPVVDPSVPPIADSVAVLDCVDISGSRLVADSDGRLLDDQVNQATRYRYRAVVVREGSRWLVERTSPALDEPC